MWHQAGLGEWHLLHSLGVSTAHSLVSAPPTFLSQQDCCSSRMKIQSHNIDVQNRIVFASIDCVALNPKLLSSPWNFLDILQGHRMERDLGVEVQVGRYRSISLSGHITPSLPKHTSYPLPFFSSSFRRKITFFKITFY